MSSSGKALVQRVTVSQIGARGQTITFTLLSTSAIEPVIVVDSTRGLDPERALICLLATAGYFAHVLGYSSVGEAVLEAERRLLTADDVPF